MKRLVVLGGGESGVGAAVLAKVKGMDVLKRELAKWVSDNKMIIDVDKEFPNYK